MENKINIAEILKDCPRGMELDCAIFNDVTLYRIDTSSENEYPIRIETKNGNFLDLTKYGTYSNVEESKCVIFPKGKTTWEGFVPPCKFKDGDILVSGLGYNNPFIFKQINGFGNAECYCAINCYGDLIFNSDNWTNIINGCRFATEEEKAKLFDVIKNNGYKWNPETKTLGKLPKFKVGDRVKKNKDYISGIVTDIFDDSFKVTYDGGGCSYVQFYCQDDWELVPTKFDVTTLKPFDKVLVRDNNEQFWTCDWFSFHDTRQVYHFACVGHYVSQCIPYIGNEHLLGTTGDCDEFYKNW